MDKKQFTSRSSTKRINLRFKDGVLCEFLFLVDIGFKEINSTPTIVQYRRGDININIYHGRQSYELGFEVIRDDKLYSLSEFIKLADSTKGRLYRNIVAITEDEVNNGLRSLRDLVKQYVMDALHGDMATFVALDNQKKRLAENLALRTRIAAFKPRADTAFRLGRYAEAAELYDKIRSGLSPSEIKKANLARKRAMKTK